MNWRAHCSGVLVILAVAAFGPAANAQTAAGKNDALYLYQGADRQQRLVEGARREGSVVFYTSMATTESMPLAQAFEKKYGVKVELWRTTSDKVVQRVITESRARRFSVDFVETNGPELEMLAREKLLSEIYSPHIADLPAAAVPAHRLWVSDRLNIFVVAYNTNKVKRESLPKTFEGFVDPKWKGLIGLEATDAEWLATIVKLWGPERGMAFFHKLADMRPDIRKGHVLFSELVAAGEIPVGLTIYSSNAESMKRRGGPIDWAPIEPVVARPQAIGVMKNAPHPHAALLFADFILSPEGQELLLSMGRVPTSLKVKSHMNNFAYTLIDAVTVLDESAKWEKVWNDLFMKR